MEDWGSMTTQWYNERLDEVGSGQLSCKKQWKDACLWEFVIESFKAQILEPEYVQTLALYM